METQECEHVPDDLARRLVVLEHAEAPPLNPELVDIALRIDPHAELVHTRPLKGGVSAQMTVLEMRSPDGPGTRKILRRLPRPDAAATEFRLLQALRGTDAMAPVPHSLDPSGDYLVLEFVEADPVFAPANVRGFVGQMADRLAKIHRIDPSKLDLPVLPDLATRLVETRPSHPDDSLDEGRIREALEPLWPLPRSGQPVLLHGDFWPGNLLWKDDRLVAVVDWEDAQVGERLADLAIARLDLLWMCGIDAMNEFTRRYASLAAVDSTTLPYWDLWAALRPASQIAEWAAGWPSHGRDDITEATMRAAHRRFVNAAFAKLPGAPTG